MIILKLNYLTENDWSYIPYGIVNVEWSNNGKTWYKERKLHREDGPAVIRVDGSKEYHLDGIFYNSKEKWFERLTLEQKIKALFNAENW